MTGVARGGPWRGTHSGWRATTLPLVHALGLLASRPPADEEAKPRDRQRSASLPGSGAGAADDAFEAFFRAHQREIFGYLWRITGDEHASYDLAQETFVRAWQRFEQVRRYEQPRAWLFRVATNLASNHRRHRSLHDAATARLGAGASSAGDPAAGIVEPDAMCAALDALPVKHPGALVLRVLYVLSFV